MFKAILLLKRRTGMSMQEFIDYYETRHQKFIAYLPGARFYKRNYVQPLDSVSVEPGQESPCDVITEIWFDDRATFDKAFANVVATGKHAEIVADEEKLFDRARMVSLAVMQESETDLP